MIANVLGEFEMCAYDGSQMVERGTAIRLSVCVLHGNRTRGEKRGKDKKMRSEIDL